jgi:GalNAc5-diNAcBac-PP-undecaprenol beta-1,3-glucosyltransferase
MFDRMRLKKRIQRYIDAQVEHRIPNKYAPLQAIELHNHSLLDLVVAMNRPQSKSRQHIAVVIATKNRFEYLLSALSSISRNTRIPTEIVISNDGIKFDESQVLQIKSLFTDQVELKILENSYPGASGARKFALEHTSAKIITYLDDDNLMWPTWIESVDRNFEDGDSLIYGAQYQDTSPENLLFESPFDLEKLVRANYIDTSAIAHRNGVGQWNPEKKRLSDWDFILGVASSGVATIRAIPRISSIYLFDSPNRISEIESAP